MGIGAPELILIIIAILVLFGGKKIPELMKGLGKGMKEFKDSQNGDDKPAAVPVTVPVEDTKK